MLNIIGLKRNIGLYMEKNKIILVFKILSFFVWFSNNVTNILPKFFALGSRGSKPREICILIIYEYHNSPKVFIPHTAYVI